MNRNKHAKPSKGFKTEESSAYLNQHPILGGKGMIYVTPYSNGKWYFRTWISEEGKYLRKSLRTTSKGDAVSLAEREYLKVYATIDRGFKIFGLKFTELCDEHLKIRLVRDGFLNSVRFQKITITKSLMSMLILGSLVH
jgi:hypothetical protein